MLLTSVVQYIKYILANKCLLCSLGCALHSLLLAVQEKLEICTLKKVHICRHFTSLVKIFSPTVDNPVYFERVLAYCLCIETWVTQRDGMTWERVRVVRSSYNIGYMSTFYKGLQSSHHFSLDISVINLYHIWNKNFKSDNLMTHNQ